MGLVLIEKDAQGSTPQTMKATSSSIMSQEILLFAKREAARIHAVSRQRQNAASVDAPFPAAHAKREVPVSRIEPQRSYTRPHVTKSNSSTATRPTKSSGSLASKKSAYSQSSSLNCVRKLSSQLMHIRSEIEGMAERLAEDVPSDLEDVDRDFDDESNRWFAREFYAVKHECSLIKKMRDISRQRVGVVKLHRTALRLVQVAASRPILRVLNPHIYGQLGDLVRELVDLSDTLELPLWDPEPILDALERAVYFPPRRASSRGRGSIAPSDIAAAIPPQSRRSVSRKKPPKAPKQTRKNSRKPSEIYSPQKRLSTPASRISTRSIQAPPKSSKAQTAQSAKKSKSISGAAAPRRTKSILKSNPTKSAVAFAPDTFDPDLIPSEGLNTIIGRLIDIDSFSGPIGVEAETPQPISDAHRATTAAPIHDGAKNNTTDVKPDIHSKPAGQTVQIRVTEPSATNVLLDRKSNHLYTSVHTVEDVDHVLAKLDRMEREENDVRKRLAEISENDFTRRQRIERQNVESKAASNVSSDLFHLRLIEEAVTTSSVLPKHLSETSKLTNEIAETLLTTLINDVVQETEQNLGSFIETIYDREMAGINGLNPMSLLSSTLNSSVTASSILDQTEMSEPTHSALNHSSPNIPNNS